MCTLTDRDPDAVVYVWFVEHGYQFALERDGVVVYEGVRDFANSYTLERLWQDFLLIQNI